MKITVEKELLLAVFDSVIAFIEINKIQQQKQARIRVQDYEGAQVLHEAEVAVAQAMPTLEEMKKLRYELADKPDILIARGQC